MWVKTSYQSLTSRLIAQGSPLLMSSPLWSKLLGLGLMVLMAIQMINSAHAGEDAGGHDERMCIACLSADREDEPDPSQDKPSKKKNNTFFDHFTDKAANWDYPASLISPYELEQRAVMVTTNSFGCSCDCTLILSCRAPPA